MKEPHKIVVSFAKDREASTTGIYCLTVLEGRSPSKTGSFQELQVRCPFQVCLLGSQMTVFSLCTCPCVQISLLYTVISQIGLGPILQTLLSLDHFYKDPLCA